MEQSAEVKIFQVDYVCDVCGVGHMRLSDRILFGLGIRPAFPHRCDHCGYEMTFTVQYPYNIRLVDVETLREQHNG